jgi:hypothetical protein
MAAKASRRFVSLLICQIRLRWTLFGFREAKSKPADLLLSQGSLKTNLEGAARTGTENGSAAPFGGRWTAKNDTSKSALNRS